MGPRAMGGPEERVARQTHLQRQMRKKLSAYKILGIDLKRIRDKIPQTIMKQIFVLRLHSSLMFDGFAHILLI
jgi:hypothetical protein